jgi:hypothetical protein
MKNSLPLSPKKRNFVCSQIANALSPNPQTIPGASRGSTCMLADTISKVIVFYTRDDISRQAPGKRDYISIKQPNGEIAQMQKVRQCVFNEFVKS